MALSEYEELAQSLGGRHPLPEYPEMPAPPEFRESWVQRYLPLILQGGALMARSASGDSGAMQKAITGLAAINAIKQTRRQQGLDEWQHDYKIARDRAIWESDRAQKAFNREMGIMKLMLQMQEEPPDPEEKFWDEVENVYQGDISKVPKHQLLRHDPKTYWKLYPEPKDPVQEEKDRISLEKAKVDLAKAKAESGVKTDDDKDKKAAYRKYTQNRDLWEVNPENIMESYPLPYLEWEAKRWNIPNAKPPGQMTNPTLMQRQDIAPKQDADIQALEDELKTLMKELESLK